MSDLSEFLLARITEEEQAWSGGLHLATRPEFSKLSQHMLADCDAKRRLVQYAEANYSTDDRNPAGSHGITVLLYLALPYADHPDYRPEWRP